MTITVKTRAKWGAKAAAAKPGPIIVTTIVAALFTAQIAVWAVIFFN